jgi:hypothetical protein
LIGVDGDADALGLAVFGVGLGAAARNEIRKRILCSLKNWKNEKKKESRLNSVWLVNKKDTN